MHSKSQSGIRLSENISNFVQNKKIMKSYSLILAAIVFFVSCNSETGKMGENSETIKVVPIETLEASAAELGDNLLQTTGLVTHICKHGGQKMFLTDESNEVHLLVRVSSSIPEFDIALEGSTIEVTGKLVATVTEVTDQKDHEHSDEEVCAAEAKMNANAESDERTSNITYHLEAISYKETI
jgi:hypothetical protein